MGLKTQALSPNLHGLTHFQAFIEILIMFSEAKNNFSRLKYISISAVYQTVLSLVAIKIKLET